MSLIDTLLAVNDEKSMYILGLSIRTWSFVIAGPCVVMATVITVFHMITHCLKNRDHQLKLHTLRILFMVPIYALNAILALFFYDSVEYFTLIREAYEAITIYSILQFLYGYLGGEQRLLYLLSLDMMAEDEFYQYRLAQRADYDSEEAMEYRNKMKMRHSGDVYVVQSATPSHTGNNNGDAIDMADNTMADHLTNTVSSSGSPHVYYMEDANKYQERSKSKRGWKRIIPFFKPSSLPSSSSSLSSSSHSTDGTSLRNSIAYDNIGNDSLNTRLLIDKDELSDANHTSIVIMHDDDPSQRALHRIDTPPITSSTYSSYSPHPPPSSSSSTTTQNTTINTTTSSMTTNQAISETPSSSSSSPFDTITHLHPPPPSHPPTQHGDQRLYPHMWPVNYCLHPVSGERLIFLCKISILQYVPIQIICALLALIAYMSNAYHPGRWTANNLYPYLSIVLNFSQIWAMYGLFHFYYTFEDALRPISALGKVMTIKGVVFFCFWQSVAISLYYTFFPACDEHGEGSERPCGEHEWNSEQQAAGLNNFLICIEMLAFAIIHIRVFSWKEFAYNVGFVAKKPVFRSVVEFFNPEDIYKDMNQNLRLQSVKKVFVRDKYKNDPHLHRMNHHGSDGNACHDNNDDHQQTSSSPIPVDTELTQDQSLTNDHTLSPLSPSASPSLSSANQGECDNNTN